MHDEIKSNVKKYVKACIAFLLIWFGAGATLTACKNDSTLVIIISAVVGYSGLHMILPRKVKGLVKSFIAFLFIWFGSTANLTAWQNNDLIVVAISSISGFIGLYMILPKINKPTEL